MDRAENKDQKLQDEVSKKYDLVGTTPGKHRFAGFGEIDLTKLTVKDAKALEAAGFPYLKAKGKAEAAEDPTQAAKGPAK